CTRGGYFYYFDYW
nr:immunoglobulin heavy chain junction region [Mus musculus]MBK4198781.1 immunoglobulin heavy chain junction region [Mus musculus]MBK4198782.1 immunoglobulin heavy chain junction region [Mus musculus]MBK4198799.1 immunoglobulin heavy chain junction region [Mus musculus]